VAAAEAQANALRLARLASVSQEQLIESTRRLLITLAHLPQVRSGDPAGCSVLFADLLKHYPGYTTFAAAEPDGNVFCSAVPLSGPVNFADRAWFQNVVQTREFAASDYVIGRISGKAILVFGYPVLDAAGQVQAVVCAGLDLGWLNQLAAEAQLPSGSTLTVVDRNGTILIRYPNPEQWVGQSVPEASLVQSILAQGEGTVEVPGVDGVPRLYAFTSLRGVLEGSAYVSVGIPSELAFAEANRVLARNLAALTLVAALALVAAWVGGDLFLLRRVNALVSATKRLSAGDLDTRSGLPYGVGELSQLALAFDEMAAALFQREAERKRAEEALTRRAREMAALYETSLEINSQREVSTLLQAIVRRAVGLLRARMGGLYLMRSDGETLELVVSHHLPGDYVSTTLRLGEGLSGRVAQAGKPMMVDDYRHWEGRAAAYADSSFRRVLGVPLKLGDRVIGVINVTDDEKTGVFDEDEVRLVSLFADQAAIAIENARLYAAEQTRRQELDTLYGLSRKLVATDEMEAVLDSIACHAVESVHVTFCRILILQDGVFICRGAHPVRLLARDLGVGRPEPPPGWPHYRRVLARVDPLVLYRDDPALGAEERQSLFLDLTQSLCLVALRMGDQAFGVLALGEARSPTREPFDADKLRLTAAMADQAAGAIHRARLHEELEAAYIETVLALANATDTRDAYTGDHSARLAAWAEAIARDLGCGAEEIRTIRWAALLHDIGKIGVPDAILRKPASLDDAEWTVMRRHPEIGAAIVAPVKKLADMAPIIRAHQEHWDGTGYPDGLKGEAIPLGARILAVVDAYGAITDERVYRKARSQAEAVAELRRCAGTQFDPQVVEAFLRVLTATGDEHDTDFARIARNMVRPSV
jgi:putative nucleotidyltransferase with HDIG domain